MSILENKTHFEASATGAIAGFADDILLTKRLVEKHFGISSIKVQDAEDYETGEQYVEIGFNIPGEIDETLRAYRRFTMEWVAAVPESSRHNIRIVYSIS